MRARRLLHLLTASLTVAALQSAPARADLTTFGYGNARLGSSPTVSLSPAAARRLRVAWRANVGGAVNGQPLSVDGVNASGRRRNLVLVGTERGAVVALDAATGRTVWRRRVGSQRLEPDCQASPGGVFGVTATLVADPRADRVYAVDVNGLGWAFALGSGKPVAGWPVRVHPAGGDFVWGALALSRGWLYVPVASLCDTGRYQGGITAVAVDHPRSIRRWLTTAGTGDYAGGIWGWGGVSIDGGGKVFAATGNSLGDSREDAGHAESVVRLSQRLRLEQADDPLRPPFTLGDRDFGTTPVLFRARGCPAQLVAIDKDGELFVYDRDSINAGPTQRLRVADDSPTGIPLLGVPAFDPASRTLVLVSPTTPRDSALRAGVQAFTLGVDCRLRPLWQQRFDAPDAGSAPTIAGGVVYIGSGRDGWIRVFALRDGAALWSGHLSTRAIFAAPTVDGTTVLVADWTGHVSALRPARAR